MFYKRSKFDQEGVAQLVAVSLVTFKVISWRHGIYIIKKKIRGQNLTH